jgi:hypothetical protein
MSHRVLFCSEEYSPKVGLLWADKRFTTNMNLFDPAFLITSPQDEPTAKTIRSKIQAWITSSWFGDLVGMFSGSIVLDGSLDETLERLEAFSERWDYRRIARERGAPTDDALRQGQGSARWLSAATGLSEAAEARVLEDVKHLGLVKARHPTHSSYDYIVALGGARLSCKFRPLLAGELIRAGVGTENIVLLGAARPVAESERDATDTYAPGASDEFDLIVAGARDAFGFDMAAYDEERHDDPTAPNLAWVVRHFKTRFEGRALKITAVSAPSSDPLRRRANSADTIIFFLEHEKVGEGNKLLLITSQIYVPYVQLEALRTVALPRGMSVETIGFPTERMSPLQGLANANHYLQEVRSTIQAARRFCQAYPEDPIKNRKEFAS